MLRYLLITLVVGAVLAALAVGLVSLLAMMPPVGGAPGMLEDTHMGVPAPLGAKETERLAREGKAVLVAIHQFKEDTGLWPMEMEELVPGWLSEKPEIWHYKWFYWNSWSLTCFAGFPHAALRYSWQDGDGSWATTDGDRDMPLEGLSGAIPKPCPANPVTRAERRLAILRHRVAGTSDGFIHRKALVAALARQGHFAEAREACRDCVRAFPDEWWPVLAEAMVDAKDDRVDEAEKRLHAWADSKGDFGHRFLLAYFLEQAGRKDEGTKQLRAAAKLPAIDFKGDRNRLPMFLWQAVAQFHRTSDHEAVLALCNRWQEYWARPGTVIDASYLSYRAASNLALARFAEAEKALTEARSHGFDIKWARNLDELGDAIKRRDRSFKYDPGKVPDSFNWEPLYE